MNVRTLVSSLPCQSSSDPTRAISSMVVQLHCFRVRRTTPRSICHLITTLPFVRVPSVIHGHHPAFGFLHLCFPHPVALRTMTGEAPDMLEQKYGGAHSTAYDTAGSHVMSASCACETAPSIVSGSENPGHIANPQKTNGLGRGEVGLGGNAFSANPEPIRPFRPAEQHAKSSGSPSVAVVGLGHVTNSRRWKSLQKRSTVCMTAATIMDAGSASIKHAQRRQSPHSLPTLWVALSEMSVWTAKRYCFRRVRHMHVVQQKPWSAISAWPIQDATFLYTVPLPTIFAGCTVYCVRTVYTLSGYLSRDSSRPRYDRHEESNLHGEKTETAQCGFFSAEFPSEYAEQPLRISCRARYHRSRRKVDIQHSRNSIRPTL